MDAKPHRPPRAALAQPFGIENLASIVGLNQAQKATGNLKAMASTGVLKAGVKRAAFADLSNTHRAPADIGAKSLKTSASVANIGKENASRGAGSGGGAVGGVGAAGLLSAPAHRPRHHSAAASAADLYSSVAEVDGPAKTKSSRPTSDSYAQLGLKQNVAKQPTFVYNDSVQPTALVGLQGEIPAVHDSLPPIARIERKSPRHFKSQPHLKPEQPLLRRTQSRLLDKVIQSSDLVILADDDITEAPYVDALEELGPLDQGSAAVVAVAPEDLVAEDYVAPVDAYETQERVIPPKDFAAATAAMSEIEEYWDEDEEFYDDQGYTTAHSYRSNGDNTTGTAGATTVILPKVTARVQKELDAAKAIVESSITQEEIDEEAWDVSMVAEYGEEIYDYMKELEMRMLPNAHYMDIQTEIQWSMRSVLMEWLVQVHTRFTLLPETLFLTVNYIDRFLSSKIVSVGKLQLVGATAIFIASKYEEINCPSIQEIVYMVDGGYTTDEILKAERFMLSMLGFELGWPGPMSFLRRISKADDYDLETRTLAKYFLEVTIMDERFVGSPPSFLAAGAHCLSRMLLHKGDWSPAHTHYSGYTWSQLKHLVSMILECCQNPKMHHAAVYEKYSDRRYKKASIYVEDEIRAGFVLPFQHQPAHFRLSVHSLLDDTSGSLALPQELGQLIPIEG